MTPETLSSIPTTLEASATQQFTGIQKGDRKQRIDHAQWIAEQNDSPRFPALELVTKPNLTTAETAYYLNRRPQTLRGWACHSGSGPIVPKRIGGLLAWNTATVKSLVGVPA